MSNDVSVFADTLVFNLQFIHDGNFPCRTRLNDINAHTEERLRPIFQRRRR